MFVFYWVSKGKCRVPIFFPIIPGVSMRMDIEMNPGSTYIEGKKI